MVQEQGLGPREALEAVRLDTAARRPSHAFLAGGDTRMGDFILLVDSDTRVPRDCILPVVTELLRSPHVAFTQHYTTPLQVRYLSSCTFAICIASGLGRATWHPLHALHGMEMSPCPWQ